MIEARCRLTTIGGAVATDLMTLLAVAQTEKIQLRAATSAASEQSEKLKELAPQIQAGTLRFKGAFPEVAAYYERIGGGAAPAVPGIAAVAPPAVETTQPSIAAPYNPLGLPSRDSVAGEYLGLDFHLKLGGSMGAYTGTITQSERTYPVRLSGDAGNLSGSFEANGGGFDAIMKILGDDVIFHHRRHGIRDQTGP